MKIAGGMSSPSFIRQGQYAEGLAPQINELDKAVGLTGCSELASAVQNAW